MKLLMMYCSRFSYTTSIKTIDEYPDIDESREVIDALVGFIQVEKEDEENAAAVETKLIKNMKWAARKNNTQTVVLHSFAHLSDSKGSHEITKKIFDGAEERLRNSDYEVSQTPFGYFLDLDLQAPGKSLARIFKAI
ncbi:MAG: threonyl-tRNA synthetase editing domain-containing protein [candidate division Zixibacteria bacterium]|nr:threonyl-tRNA synthetase editing domain-containing protein [candidate division Zixibacteria bacterium]